jgi:ketosteroid isomerase-like protein
MDNGVADFRQGRLDAARCLLMVTRFLPVDPLSLTVTAAKVFMIVFASAAPDGRRIDGKAAVVEFWRGWFGRNADARFEAEEVIVSGSRATVLWVYRKMRNGQPWHLRGVDIFTVRDGKVAAKLAYVKG